MLKKFISYDQQKFKWQSYSYMQDIYRAKRFFVMLTSLVECFCLHWFN